MKRLKQINESKKMIFDGLMELLKNKSYDDISISEIAQEAGVVRMTFYRHFKEKEDIILFGFEQILKEAIKLMDDEEHFSLNTLLVFRFKTLKESPYTSILAKHKKLNKLFQTIGTEFSHHFSEVIPEIKSTYDQAFVAGGLDAMTALWIKNGMKESPELMARRSLEIVKLISGKNST